MPLNFLEDREIQKRDVEGFKAFQRHGPMTREYLLALLGMKSDPTHFRKRIRSFCPLDFHESVNQPFYMPRFQKNGMWRYHSRVFDISASCREWLKREGYPYRDYGPRGENGRHRYMRASCSASLEIAAREAGWRYLSIDEFIDRDGLPQATYANPLRFHLGGDRYLELDGLFNAHTQKEYRTHAIEADRGTERIRSTNKDQTSVEQKIPGYDTIIENGLFQRQWGIEAMNEVLFVTTTEARRDSVLDMIREVSRFPEWYLVQHQPLFGDDEFKAAPILRGLFTGAWHGVNGSVFINQ